MEEWTARFADVAIDHQDESFAKPFFQRSVARELERPIRFVRWTMSRSRAEPGACQAIRRTRWWDRGSEA